MTWGKSYVVFTLISVVYRRQAAVFIRNALKKPSVSIHAQHQMTKTDKVSD